MRDWWREKDFSSVLDEQVITCEMQADDIVERIYQDLLKACNSDDNTSDYESKGK